jgi:hypothetical protein
MILIEYLCVVTRAGQGYAVPQGLRVQVPWVRSTSPGPKYLQYPCRYVAEFFWDEETPKTQFYGILHYFWVIWWESWPLKLGENALNTPNPTSTSSTINRKNPENPAKIVKDLRVYPYPCCTPAVPVPVRQGYVPLTGTGLSPAQMGQGYTLDQP